MCSLGEDFNVVVRGLSRRGDSANSSMAKQFFANQVLKFSKTLGGDSSYLALSIQRLSVHAKLVL